MGIITWIVIGVIILAIIGLGWHTFFVGVKKGADKIGLTPIIRNITNQAKHSFGGLVKNLPGFVSVSIGYFGISL